MVTHHTAGNPGCSKAEAAARAKEGDGEGSTDEAGKPGDHRGDRRVEGRSLMIIRAVASCRGPFF